MYKTLIHFSVCLPPNRPMISYRLGNQTMPARILNNFAVEVVIVLSVVVMSALILIVDVVATLSNTVENVLKRFERAIQFE